MTRNPHRRESAQASNRGRGITVLLCDDDPAVCALVEAALEPIGCTLLKAHDSDQALRASDAHPGNIDLLIADQVMPPFMSGQELAQCLRLLRPDVKVLYVSGYGAADLVLEDLGAPGTDFLAKPFSPDQLLDKLGKLSGRNLQVT